MMDNFGSVGPTEDFTSFSVDDILREYRDRSYVSEPAAVPRAGRGGPSQKEDVPEAEESDVKLYRPSGRIAQMEEDARRYVSTMDSGPSAGPARHAAPENEESESEFDSLFHIHAPFIDRDAGEGYQGPEAPSEEAAQPEPTRGKKLFGRREKKRPINAPPERDDSMSAGFTDAGVAPGDYAPDREYDVYEEEQEDAPRPKFPGMRGYLTGQISALLLRLRPRAEPGTATVSEDEEELGPEVPVRTAMRYYGSFIRSLRLRSRIAFVLILIMSYISLGLPVPGMLQSARVASGLLLASQLTVMLLSLDVVTGAVTNLSRRRFGADAMALLLCILTSIDAVGVVTGSFGSLHMPLCAVSSLSLAGQLLAAVFNARGLRKAMRVPAIGKKVMTVTGEYGVCGRELTLLKVARPPKGFVFRSEESSPDETLFNRLSPILLIISLLFAFIASALSHNSSDILYLITAMLSPAVPFTALLCFSLPFFVGSMRMFNDGAAIAGWSGLRDVGQSRNLIVTDRDLFPSDNIELEGIRIFADESAEKVIAYAGTLITASGCGLAPCFGELMEKHGCTMRHVENFEYLAGGGIQGVIDGQTVLCGSSDLMRLMNVRIPFRLVDSTTVLLAIDGILYGIFSMKYTPDPKIRKALLRLIRSSRHPVFAVRDFNVTPQMIHKYYDVATDGYDFPPYVDRYAISEARPSSSSKVAAVVCREDLNTMTVMADTGRGMYVAVRTNILLSVLSVVIGMVTVFIKLSAGGVFGVGAGFLLTYMLAWALPAAVLSMLPNRVGVP